MSARGLLVTARAARATLVPAFRHAGSAFRAGLQPRAVWSAPRLASFSMPRGFSSAADGGEEGNPAVSNEGPAVADAVEDAAQDLAEGGGEGESGVSEEPPIELSEWEALERSFGKGPLPGLHDGGDGWPREEFEPVVHNSYPGTKFPPPRTGKDWQAQLHIRAFDPNVIEYASAYVRHMAAILGVRTGNVVPLPKKTKLWSVLRSPHVHKKSQEQFQMMTYKRLINVYDTQPETLDTFYEELEQRPPVGVLIKIKDRRGVELPAAAP